MKKLTFLIVVVFAFLTLTKNANGQCIPDNCSLLITNKIDCIVKLEIVYKCPPSGITYTREVLLAPGTAAYPSVIDGNTLFSSDFLCNCNNIEIVSIGVKQVGSSTYSPPITLSSSTTNLYAVGCCNLNYGSFSGCNVVLWMSCP